jgi:hypothetical protein
MTILGFSLIELVVLFVTVAVMYPFTGIGI